MGIHVPLTEVFEIPKFSTVYPGVPYVLFHSCLLLKLFLQMPFLKQPYQFTSLPLIYIIIFITPGGSPTTYQPHYIIARINC